MAATIHIADPKEQKRALRIFKQYGDTLPTEVANTYHVRDHILEKLEHKHVRFERVSYWLKVTEKMFDHLDASFREAGTEPPSSSIDIDQLFE